MRGSGMSRGKCVSLYWLLRRTTCSILGPGYTMVVVVVVFLEDIAARGLQYPTCKPLDSSSHSSYREYRHRHTAEDFRKVHRSVFTIAFVSVEETSRRVVA